MEKKTTIPLAMSIICECVYYRLLNWQTILVVRPTDSEGRRKKGSFRMDFQSEFGFVPDGECG